ncbi:hypothetical protein GGX14DRAFT_405362 [Mycena pura]|uniref:Uncharacterized protein n=1 Tax=Mycena pura TaxID=153505 RepID=A0AAD6UU38_9AGAR|nr:hypothetical protein GGX14DRAFT_405362 [Mycena pura]
MPSVRVGASFHAGSGCQGPPRRGPTDLPERRHTRSLNVGQTSTDCASLSSRALTLRRPHPYSRHGELQVGAIKSNSTTGNFAPKPPVELPPLQRPRKYARLKMRVKVNNVAGHKENSRGLRDSEDGSRNGILSRQPHLRGWSAEEENLVHTRFDDSTGGDLDEGPT